METPEQHGIAVFLESARQPTVRYVGLKFLRRILKFLSYEYLLYMKKNEFECFALLVFFNTPGKSIHKNAFEVSVGTFTSMVCDFKRKARRDFFMTS